MAILSGINVNNDVNNVNNQTSTNVAESLAINEINNVGEASNQSET